VQTPYQLLWQHQDDNVRYEVDHSCRNVGLCYVQACTGYGRFPQLLTRVASKDLQESADEVEHNVDAKKDMASPPKRVTMAAGYESLGPFEEDADFQTHDHVPVDCGANVHVLDAMSTRRGKLLCSETYIGSIEHGS
jgi:hypothetical protein